MTYKELIPLAVVGAVCWYFSTQVAAAFHRLVAWIGGKLHPAIGKALAPAPIVTEAQGVIPQAITPEAAYARWMQDHQYGQVTWPEILWLKSLSQDDRTAWAIAFGAATKPENVKQGAGWTSVAIAGAPISVDALSYLLGLERAYGLVFET